jgi:putative hydrolase of the HAD superfamily
VTGENVAQKRWLLFDWGDTLMRDDPSAEGPMVTWTHVEIVQGAVEVLTTLKPEWGLALATNAVASEEDQIRAALRRVGLDALIERIYCFRGVGYKKPAPEFFAFVLNDLGATVDQVVMVGDSFDIDVVGANNMGIQAIWLNERSDEIRVGALHRTILNLIDLPCALTELIAQNKLNRRG